MSQLPTNVLYHGIDRNPPLSHELHAGPLTMLFEQGDLRYVKLGSTEILRRVYAAVRDHNWSTIPRQINYQVLQIHQHWFRIQYEAHHRQAEIDFVWAVEITGDHSGAVTFSIDGEARSSFRSNRIGFCVLHPTNLAGLPCTIEHPDGSFTTSNFPSNVAPHQPFMNIRAIRHVISSALQPDIQADIRMEGETFETEDQRNWTDDSYKTYCRPLAAGFPFTVEKGSRIQQKITLKLIGDTARFTQPVSEPLALTATGHFKPLPGLGLEINNNNLTDLNLTRLKALNLTHLRVNLKLWRTDITETLRRASTQAKAVGVPLEIALFLSDNANSELLALRNVVDSLKPSVIRWLVFHRGESVTASKWVWLARESLADFYPAAQFGAGTNANFTELNRNHPPQETLDLIDFVSFAVNPQVHAFENRDLVENLPTQARVVEDSRQFTHDKAVIVSPVTLKQRWNPVATGETAPLGSNELPTSVDLRQMSLIGAGWTLGSLKYLAGAGAQSVTYYETTGWLGVMEREEGASNPNKFQSIPGGVFPLYFVLAAIGDYAGGEVESSVSTVPLAVEGIILRKNNRVRLILANYTPRPQTVKVRGLREEGSPVTVVTKTLDETNIQDAMANPEGWRGMPGVRMEFGVSWQHGLKPYGLLIADIG